MSLLHKNADQTVEHGGSRVKSSAKENDWFDLAAAKGRMWAERTLASVKKPGEYESLQLMLIRDSLRETRVEMQRQNELLARIADRLDSRA